MLIDIPHNLELCGVLNHYEECKLDVVLHGDECVLFHKNINDFLLSGSRQDMFRARGFDCELLAGISVKLRRPIKFIPTPGPVPMVIDLVFRRVSPYLSIPSTMCLEWHQYDDDEVLYPNPWMYTTFIIPSSCIKSMGQLIYRIQKWIT